MIFVSVELNLYDLVFTTSGRLVVFERRQKSDITSLRELDNRFLARGKRVKAVVMTKSKYPCKTTCFPDHINQSIEFCRMKILSDQISDHFLCRYMTEYDPSLNDHAAQLL
jgi:hypothetical protein